MSEPTLHDVLRCLNGAPRAVNEARSGPFGDTYEAAAWLSAYLKEQEAKEPKLGSLPEPPELKSMDGIREKILAVVDQKHGAFWGDFYDALIHQYSADDIQKALRSLVADQTLRMKDDDEEHDWEYRRTAPKPANQIFVLPRERFGENFIPVINPPGTPVDDQQFYTIDQDVFETYGPYNYLAVFVLEDRGDTLLVQTDDELSRKVATLADHRVSQFMTGLKRNDE